MVYGLRAETQLTEHTMGHLDGYRDSSPVRIGNAAATQRQLDIFGEVLDAADELARIGVPPSAERWAWLSAVADHVCGVWRGTDRGIWEVRGPERHFTYSKVMCWVALDRALRMSAALGLPGDTARWAAERAAVHAAVLREGWDPRQKAFTQSFGSPVLDASALLLPIVGFLPADDPRVRGTVDAVLGTLTRDGLVFRYPAEETPDGVGGGRAPSASAPSGWRTRWPCAGAPRRPAGSSPGWRRAPTTWASSRRRSTRPGGFLGNFPQAFTHVGLIDAAGALGYDPACAAPAAGPPRASGS